MKIQMKRKVLGRFLAPVLGAGLCILAGMGCAKEIKRVECFDGRILGIAADYSRGYLVATLEVPGKEVPVAVYADREQMRKYCKDASYDFTELASVLEAEKAISLANTNNRVKFFVVSDEKGYRIKGAGTLVKNYVLEEP